MGSGFGTLCSRKKSESPAPERSDPACHRSHGVGHREIARREDSRILADLRPRRLSLGPHAKANRRPRADFAQFSGMSDKRETDWWMTQSAANCSPHHNSLLTGKMQGISGDLGSCIAKKCWCYKGFPAKFPTQLTGNFYCRTGNLYCTTANLSCLTANLLFGSEKASPLRSITRGESRNVCA
jgi:hypothetical protein